ncbi:Fc.00g037470.m01.CDS01 [Cosmosporella sp. VM-42]
MSLKTVPTYYSAPNFSIPPPDSNGPLHLGTLIADLKDPIPLNSGVRLPIPDHEIFRGHLAGFSTTIKKSRDIELGIFLKLLGLEGLGGELSMNRGRSLDEQLFINRLETQYFNPSLAYMNGSMNLQPVKAFRQACRDSLPVFLITGIKVARGASASIVKARSVGGSGQLGVMEPFTGLAEVGPKAQSQWTTEQGISFHESSDFVLAYRVTRLRWKKGTAKGKPCTSGATMVDDTYGSADELDGSAEFVRDFKDEGLAVSVIDELGSAFVETSRWVIFDTTRCQ